MLDYRDLARHADELRHRRSGDALASLLAEHYRGLLRTRLHLGDVQLQPFAEMTPSYRRYFRDAARDCAAVKASPRAFVLAQFVAFDMYSRAARKHLVPQPAQLFGIGAQARYLEYHATTEKQLRTDAKKVHSQHGAQRFYSEERKLRAWSASNNISPQEVLLRWPREFTREFIEHKGVAECL